MKHDFSDIEPYSDEQLQPALARIIESPQFLAGVARLGMPKLSMIAPGIARFLAKHKLKGQFRRLRTIADLQDKVAPFMRRVVNTTIEELIIEGVAGLGDRPCLFISNHRDIVMDPALVNWALHQAGRDTVRIAIGDNLLKQPFVEDLMRLNKSFVVRRNVAGPRELAKIVGQLSAYIGHSVITDQHSVWIAQKEGRAKDGIDKTDPAVIKMISMAGRKHPDGIAGYLRQLNIVPVYISYEIDPCDSAKAVELWKTAHEAATPKPTAKIWRILCWASRATRAESKWRLVILLLTKRHYTQPRRWSRPSMHKCSGYISLGKPTLPRRSASAGTTVLQKN